ELPHDLVPKLWKGQYRGQTQKWFLLRFTGDDAEIDIETKEPEFREWAWMPADTLIEKIVPFKRATYETVLGEFADQITGV
ncbi:MAG: NUDIX domain-containing protein, partial [Pikeienuella sp.]